MSPQVFFSEALEWKYRRLRIADSVSAPHRFASVVRSEAAVTGENQPAELSLGRKSRRPYFFVLES
jgi:hypothetical protein